MKKGFTLAEVLLTLAVIGIVAAITLPSLLVDTTEKAFDAQRRALHARLSQAIGMMSSLSGYGQYVEEVKNEDSTTKTEGKDDAAETFLYEGLSKVYKMNNICDSENLDKCGIPSSITKMNGDIMTFPKKLSELNPEFITSNLTTSNLPSGTDVSLTDTKVAAFETVNGESIAVFYNPYCKNDLDSGTRSDDTRSWYFIQNKMCVNFVYDLNGAKGPNKAGRDIGFISVIGSKNPEVAAPVPYDIDGDESRTHTQQEEVELCASDDMRLPNKYEIMSLFYNKYLVGNLGDNYSYWSSSVASSALGWNVYFGHGDAFKEPRSSRRFIRCVIK